MKNNLIQLVLADPSHVVMSGFQTLLAKGKNRVETHFAENSASVESLLQHRTIDIVLMNPMLMLNLEKQFAQLRNDHPTVKWIAVLYGWFDESVVSQFDARVLLNDSADTILSVVQNTLDEERDESASSRQPLSERELDVLKLLVLGMSNKEIADKLFISTYTVISHRKNITQKTGIKSVSGLTIYAVVKGIVNLPNLIE
ncbi:MAG: response regulator transcription factor [Bacteroidales bacterium]